MQKFSFDRNRCLNCEIELYEGAESLFCSNCEPVFPKKTIGLALMQHDAHIGAQETAAAWLKKEVKDLVDYEIGYVKRTAIYRGEISYRIPINSEVREKPDKHFSLKIIRHKDLIMLESGSIGDIWLKDKKPPFADIDSFEVRIVNFDL